MFHVFNKQVAIKQIWSDKQLPNKIWYMAFQVSRMKFVRNIDLNKNWAINFILEITTIAFNPFNSFKYVSSPIIFQCLQESNICIILSGVASKLNMVNL